MKWPKTSNNLVEKGRGCNITSYHYDHNDNMVWSGNMLNCLFK